MNAISDPPSTSRNWLEDRWARIENVTMPRDEYEQLLVAGQVDEIKVHAVQTIVVCLERFLRSLAFVVVHAGWGTEASRLGTGAWDFLAILDKNLGKTTYEIINT